MADIHENIDGGNPAGGETSPSGALGDLLLMVYEQLKDEFGVNWPPSKLLPYLNYFVLETLNLKPEAYTEETTVSLVTGARQSLPAGTIALIDALYNITTVNTYEVVTAPAITLINKKNLDFLFPGWLAADPDSSVSFVVKDDRNPNVFYTYPPQPASPGVIKLLLSAPPAEIDTDSTEIPFDDSYKPACVDYLLYRALIEETTIQGANAKALTFFNKFLQDLGLKSNTEKQTESKGG